MKKMTALQCNANSCANNNRGFCCRPVIKVKGTSAHVTAETRCGSYSERVDSLSNSTGYESPNQSLDIACDAKNCYFNSSKKCSADSICIDCRSSGTECSSFRSR